MQGYGGSVRELKYNVANLKFEKKCFSVPPTVIFNFRNGKQND